MTTSGFRGCFPSDAVTNIVFQEKFDPSVVDVSSIEYFDVSFMDAYSEEEFFYDQMMAAQTGIIQTIERDVLGIDIDKRANYIEKEAEQRREEKEDEKPVETKEP